MAITVKKIINNPINSNSFVVYDKEKNNNCFIVDPGTKDCLDLEEFIVSEHLLPSFILLTHEHFDHCWGCNYLQAKYPIPIIGSKECIERIRNHKTNCSVFYNPSIAFDINGSTQEISSGEYANLNGFKIKVYSTPGHTESSISIFIYNHLFTGDALINGMKTVTKLPRGSKTKDIETMSFFKTLKGNGIIVHPGHLDEFYLDDLDFN